VQQLGLDLHRRCRQPLTRARPDALPDPATYAECMQGAFQDLLTAANDYHGR